MSREDWYRYVYRTKEGWSESGPMTHEEAFQHMLKFLKKGYECYTERAD